MIYNIKRLSFINVCILVLIAAYTFSSLITASVGINIGALILPFILFLFCSYYGFDCIKMGTYEFLYVLFFVLTLPSILVGEDYFLIIPNLISYFFLFLLVKTLINSPQQSLLVFKFLLLTISLMNFLLLLELGKYFFYGNRVSNDMLLIQFGLPVIYAGKGNPNGAGSLLLFGPPLCILFLRMQSSYLKRGFLLMLLSVSILTLIFTYSRSALLGSSIASIGIATIKYRKNSGILISKRVLISAFLLISVLLIPVYFSIMDMLSSNMTTTSSGSVLQNKQGSVDVRIELTKHFLLTMFENPLVGIGYGEAKGALLKEASLSLSAHNIFIAIGLEFGLIALTIFCLIIYLSVYLPIRRARTLHGWDRVLLLSISYLGIALVIHGLFHEIYVFSLFWLVVAMGIYSGSKSNTTVNI